jgi:D-alanyl-D-alanine-carboxypeptidase/D-alanyl-D-alanine-endopeptidase
VGLGARTGRLCLFLSCLSAGGLITRGQDIGRTDKSVSLNVSWPSLSGQPRDYLEAKAYLRDLVREFDIPALAVAIVETGRATFLSEGYCDPLGRRAVTDKTVFRASRLGMLVFNYLVLRLESEGALKLDLPLAQYFPGGAPPDAEFVALASDPRWPKVTARQILVHSSGLAASPEEGGELRFASDSGREFRFSDDGYRLLQYAIEARTGRGLDDLAREFVFKPIGMVNSSYDWNALASGNFARSLAETPSPTYLDGRIRPDAARSFLSCTNDLSRFVQTVFRRGFRLDLQNLIDINTTTADVSSRTITRSPRTAGPVMRAKGIYWSLLGGKFKNPWPGKGDPYFHPGREDGCENYIVGFPARSLTLILLSVPGRGGGHVREILRELIGDVFSPWSWLEYE